MGLHWPTVNVLPCFLNAFRELCRFNGLLQYLYFTDGGTVTWNRDQRLPIRHSSIFNETRLQLQHRCKPQEVLRAQLVLKEPSKQHERVKWLCPFQRTYRGPGGKRRRVKKMRVRSWRKAPAAAGRNDGSRYVSRLLMVSSSLHSRLAQTKICI